MNLGHWIRQALADDAPKSKSLIVTVFGDALMPVADRVWLGDLITLMAPFAVNERLVRTSCFRLIDEGWFVARRDGRRSEYALTDAGRRRLARGYERVYAPPVTTWDGRWTLLLLPRPADAGINRSALRRELEWEGFAQLLPGVMIHPLDLSAVVHERLAAGSAGERLIALRAEALPGLAAHDPTAWLPCWDLAAVAARYRAFLARFAPLAALLANHEPDGPQAYVLQTLLIHAFRRATLHDPRLPATLLPDDWPGAAAFALCRALYRRTVDATHRHVAATIGADGDAAASPRPALLQQRFGGLADD